MFNPKVRPWVNVQGADKETIRNGVNRCPSGALNIQAGEEPTPLTTDIKTEEEIVRVQILPNGPAIIQSRCVIKLPDGKEEMKEGKVALCRCGASGNKPYCDGSHNKIKFVG